MKSLCCVIPSKGTVEFVDQDRSRTPGPKELRIQTLFSLISPGTELAMFLGQHVGIDDPSNTFAKYPFAAGYSAVGTVMEAGCDVQGLSPGQRVYFEGAHEAVAIVDVTSKNVRAVPVGIDSRFVPFARIAQIASTAVLVARPGASSVTVAIVGLGLVGNLAAQLFQARGHRVIGIDMSPARRAWAEQSGIACVVGTDGGDIAERVAAQAPEGVDICIEATGNTLVIQQALKLVRNQGQVVLLGSPRGKAEIDVYNNIHRSGVSLVGAHERVLRSQPARLIDVTDDMLARLGSGALRVAPLITHVRPPSTLQDCYRLLHREQEATLGVMLDWTTEALA